MKVHCSKLGDFMVNGRTKADPIGKGCFNLLDEMMIKQLYNRRPVLNNKYIKKGNEVEEDSITLWSNYLQQICFKNGRTFENEYIKGTPDIIGEDWVCDTKSSWDIFTFKKAELSNEYEWQLRGYLWLTDKPVGYLAYCLVDTPSEIISDELYRLKWQFAKGEDDPKYDRDAEQTLLNLTTTGIPEANRIKVFKIERDAEKEQAIIDRYEAVQEYVKNWSLNG